MCDQGLLLTDPIDRWDTSYGDKYRSFLLERFPDNSLFPIQSLDRHIRDWIGPPAKQAAFERGDKGLR